MVLGCAEFPESVRDFTANCLSGREREAGKRHRGPWKV